MEGDNSPNMDDQNVDELAAKVDKLQERVNELEQFYLDIHAKQSATSKSASNGKEKEKHIPGTKKLQMEASRREAAAAKRMQDLMRQFGSILQQFTQDKWAWPFMQPVDVEGLGLHDYYKVIDRPMDFRTIKNQMEAMDGAGYKHVREICADVRLVFKNAIKYNDEKSDVHVMAKSLLTKFEEKWLQFLPKVTDEEKKREEEEAEAQLHAQRVQEAAHAKMTRDLSTEAYDLDVHLDHLQDIVAKKCRKISSEEKRKLGVALSKLSPEDLSKALQIVAQCNPSFQLTSEEVELDISTQSDSTLWRLKVFVKDRLDAQAKNPIGDEDDGGEDDDSSDKSPKTDQTAATDTDTVKKEASRRKREIYDALAKTAKKRNGNSNKKPC